MQLGRRIRPQGRNRRRKGILLSNGSNQATKRCVIIVARSGIFSSSFASLRFDFQSNGSGLIRVDASGFPALNLQVKSSFFLWAVLGLALFTAGCARNYNVTMGGGRVITSRGKPHYDKVNSVFIFKDVSGQERRVPAGSVTSVAPASDKAETTGFNPKPAR